MWSEKEKDSAGVAAGRRLSFLFRTRIFFVFFPFYSRVFLWRRRCANQEFNIRNGGWIWAHQGNGSHSILSRIEAADSTEDSLKTLKSKLFS